MSADILLQMFIMIDVFVAGAVLALVFVQLYAHARSKRETQARVEIAPQREQLSPVVKEHLADESQAAFEAVLSKSAAGLEHDLGSTAELLDKLVKRLGAEIVSDELERYRIELTNLRQQAQKNMGAIKEEMGARRGELEAQLKAELSDEKNRLLAQIDTKLADAVVSFLVEAMQHQIDLGAQEPYLRALLEEHKAEFRKEVGDESKPT